MSVCWKFGFIVSMFIYIPVPSLSPSPSYHFSTSPSLSMPSPFFRFILVTITVFCLPLYPIFFLLLIFLYRLPFLSPSFSSFYITLPISSRSFRIFLFFISLPSRHIAHHLASAYFSALPTSGVPLCGGDRSSLLCGRCVGGPVRPGSSSCRVSLLSSEAK